MMLMMKLQSFRIKNQHFIVFYLNICWVCMYTCYTLQSSQLSTHRLTAYPTLATWKCSLWRQRTCTWTFCTCYLSTWNISAIDIYLFFCATNYYIRMQWWKYGPEPFDRFDSQYYRGCCIGSSRRNNCQCWHSDVKTIWGRHNNTVML